MPTIAEGAESLGGIIITTIGIVICFAAWVALKQPKVKK